MTTPDRIDRALEALQPFAALAERRDVIDAMVLAVRPADRASLRAAFAEARAALRAATLDPDHG